jgi:periplasmic copper chaperone A
MRRLTILACAVAAAFALASPAFAHVTVHPNALPSGGFTVINVRVPNERPKAATTRVDVKFPSGFIFLSYARVPGWSTKVLYRKLAKPVTVFGEKFTQEVDRVVWSGGRIAPGQFAELPLSVAMPGAPSGTVLTFKAVQTYSNGEVVRWIGSPDAETPAPQVLVTGKNSGVADYPGGVTAAKSARRSSSFNSAFAAVLGLSALAAVGLGIARRKRNAA